MAEDNAPHARYPPRPLSDPSHEHASAAHRRGHLPAGRQVTPSAPGPRTSAPMSSASAALSAGSRRSRIPREDGNRHDAAACSNDRGRYGGGVQVAEDAGYVGGRVDGRTRRTKGVGRSHIGRIIRLATLAPEINRDILAGGEPRPLSQTHLRDDLPLSWLKQHRLLGISGS